MINCRYCGHEMQSKTLLLSGYARTIISCKNHGSVKVGYKLLKIGSFVGDNWTISFGDYRLSYYDPIDRTLFQLRHPEAKSASQYFELIKKFDSELEITPEQFPGKINMLVNWS